MSQEQVSINVSLGGRTYRLKVSSNDEAQIRLSLNKIQESFSNLKQQFPGRDEQDYLSMTLIDFVTSGNTNTTQDIDKTKQELRLQLERINELLG